MNKYETLEKVFLQACDDINIHPTEEERILFKEFYNELIFWNKKMSLVSIKSPFDIPIKHFIDSLTILTFIKKQDSKLLDIGSGAGFPGIPIKIINKSLNLFFIESSRKKTSFLRHITLKLNLENIKVINKRVEQVIKERCYQNTFDIIVSRAAFKLPEFLKVGTHFLSKNGVLIAMKGKNIGTELTEAKSICRNLQLELSGNYEIKLPIINDARNILLFTKLSC